MKKINRRARFDYVIYDSLEAGIRLTGQEVKSVKSGHIQLESAHVRILAEEVFLINAIIPLYPFAHVEEYDPHRTRKLLLKRKQITSLQSKMQAKKLTVIPLSCYTTRGLIKIEIALAKAKKSHDVRKSLREKDIKRDIEQALRNKE